MLLLLLLRLLRIDEAADAGQILGVVLLAGRRGGGLGARGNGGGWRRGRGGLVVHLVSLWHGVGSRC
jgi:hypothetical protein